MQTDAAESLATEPSQTGNESVTYWGGEHFAPTWKNRVKFVMSEAAKQSHQMKKMLTGSTAELYNYIYIEIHAMKAWGSE